MSSRHHCKLRIHVNCLSNSDYQDLKLYLSYIHQALALSSYSQIHHKPFPDVVIFPNTCSAFVSETQFSEEKCFLIGREKMLHMVL